MLQIILQLLQIVGYLNARLTHVLVPTQTQAQCSQCTLDVHCLCTLGYTDGIISNLPKARCLAVDRHLGCLQWTPSEARVPLQAAEVSVNC